MNKAILIGNLCKDPEQRTTQGGVAVTSFTLAVRRKFKDADGNYTADFINCVAWRQTAEFVAKYFTKGMKIGVVGTIQTRTYNDANGVKRYVTEVSVEEAEFVEGKKGGGTPGAADDFAAELSDFQPMDDAELPF